jgi:hypothetical protein
MNQMQHNSSPQKEFQYNFGTGPVDVMLGNRNLFTQQFIDWLPDNLHIFKAFTREAIKVHEKGFKHYSARTIIHFLRHHSALTENNGEWKINNNHSPYLARLFDLMYPDKVGLWEYRETKAVTDEQQYN